MKTDTQNYTLEYGNRLIEYNLHRKDRKRMRITVSPNLTVNVFIPHKSNENQIFTALAKKAPWIVRKLDLMRDYQPLSVPKNYISGETFIYLGRQYRLKVRKGNNNSAKLKGHFLEIECKEKKRESVQNIVKKWYRKRAADVFERYLTKSFETASRHDVPEPEMTIRDMTRRWGSCSSANRITLNLKLTQVPVHCIEYVIMHELCHLKYHDHSRKFLSLLTRCQPDWKKRKETLRKILLTC